LDWAGILKTADEIVALHRLRSGQRGDYLSRMKEISRHYNNEVTVPLPELDANEKPAVANLLAQGIDQFSLRVASVMPDVQFPPLRGNIEASVENARKRRLAALGWFDMNDMNMKMRRRARYQVAYASSPVSIHPVSLNPNDKREIPFWRVRNPLTTFPSDVVDPDNMEPDDCIFEDARTLRWIKENYPSAASVLYTGKSNDSTLITVLEYVDAEESVLVAVGVKRESKGFLAGEDQTGVSQIVLARVPNRAGICPVVVPTRIALDKVMSKFEAMMGMFHRQAKLDALNTIAVQRGVFPDEWLVPHPNAQGMEPKIVQNADGKYGIRGIIKNGQIMAMNPMPGQQSEQTLDRLERNARLSAGIPSEWGGESGSNIRTAKRGDSVLSEAVDPDIQETQEIFAASMEAEIRRAIAFQKAYYGKKPTLFLLGLDGKVGKYPDYTPNDAFETDLCRVTYPLPGSDANAMSVMIGQKVGIGEMSVQTAMEMDPLIKDAESETARIHMEGIRKALLTGLEQQASQGQLDPATIARIAKELGDGSTTIEEAVVKVHEQEQKKQADKQNAQSQQGGSVPGMAGVPGQPGAAGLPGGMEEAQPEDQPGLAAQSPDQMAQASAPIGAPPAGLTNLKDLLGSLHTSTPSPLAS
jgi:hypothetical protein